MERRDIEEQIFRTQAQLVHLYMELQRLSYKRGDKVTLISNTGDKYPRYIAGYHDGKYSLAKVNKNGSMCQNGCSEHYIKHEKLLPGWK